MKTRKNLLIGILAVIVGFVGFTSSYGQPGKSESAERESPTQEDVGDPPKEERKSIEDFWAAGQNVDVKGEGATGDVAVAGANVTISEGVAGYVMAAGANVTINAPVGNDLWAAGATVIVNGPVSDNAMLAGSSVVLEKDGTIGKDAKIAAGTVEINANVERDLYVSGGTVVISSEIGGDLEIFAENISLSPGAIVRGKLVAHSPNDPVISPKAQVIGDVDYRKIESTKSTSSAVKSWFSSWFLNFLWITVLGLVAVWFSPVWTDRVVEILRVRVGKSFLVGLITIIALPVAFILLLITIVGVPLALLLGALVLIAFLFSGAVVSYLVGDWFLSQLKRWEKSNVLKVVFGALIVTLVMSLPWIGWIAKFAVMFFGIGAFLLERRDLVHKLREQSLA